MPADPCDPELFLPGATSTWLEVNGLRLHAMAAGPTDGPLILLLHGFPEFWFGWRNQILPLAEAGYRVLAPDQRGYNWSDKPAGVRAYRAAELVADVDGLIRASGRSRATLIGHDWGAAVAWWTAIRLPSLVERLVVMNVPHPRVMATAVRHSWEQRLRSWYILYFQLPHLPEIGLRLPGWQPLERSMHSSARRGTFSPEVMRCYRQAWSQPGAMTAMINWYRALLRHRPERLATPEVLPPTLVIWGARDRFLISSMAAESVAQCRDGELALFEDATHWVQHEEPERVNQRILRFLGNPAERTKVVLPGL